MKKTLFVGFLVFALGAVTGGTIVHFAMKGYDPRTIKVAVGAEAVAALEKTATPELPTEFTIGGRTYELVQFVSPDRTWHQMPDHSMVFSAQALNANLGQADGQFFHAHSEEIPDFLRHLYIIFPDWGDSDPKRGGKVACLMWENDGWRVSFRPSSGPWSKQDRLVRHKS